MDSVGEQVASLRREIMTRHEDSVAVADSRHGEVVQRLDRIDEPFSRHAEKMSSCEAVTGYLREEWTLIRRRYYEMVNARQGDPFGDGAVVRRVDAKLAVTLYAGGIASVIALLKLLGKI